jgi:hypothetical protein
MIFTIIQVVLLILIFAAVVPNVIRTFKAGRLKLGFGLLITILGILGVISSIYLHVNRGYQALDPKVLAKIDQLDAANVAADVQRFHKDHPESKSTFQPESLSAEGIKREFDLALRSADVPALSRICKQISEDPFSEVTITTITDNPQICGITRVERPSERDESRSGIPRRMAIYQYEMTDSKQKPFGGKCYLAVSWSKKSGAWALESAITTGSFFRIERKP